jgi:iron complex outermembrane receptor protein
MGPEALNWDPVQWQSYIAFVNATYGTRPPTSNNGAFFFAQPVNEKVNADSVSQEFRLTSGTEGRFDWIAGAYYKNDKIDKFDRFIGENFLGLLAAGNPVVTPLSTISGESHWSNEGEMTNYAVFGQLGFKFTEALKLSVGLRWTKDEKEGDVSAFVAETGDRFNPNDPRANVTIESLCRAPDGTVVAVATGQACLPPNKWTYGEGEGFQTHYSSSWDELTPQATLDWKISDDIFAYLTYSEGFKGGGYDDTPANIPQATTPFDPEKVKNYELGVKTMFWDRRVRINADVFFMDYTNLQVTQTNAACLCNLTDNAASAEIKGVEAEFEFLPIDALRLTLSGSYVDAKYKDFIESAIDPTTGQHLISTDNTLQRTPDTQLAAGIDYQWGWANFSVNYSWQSEMFWATDNIAKEPEYGLVDARINIAPEGKEWSVGIWGKNLTDELYRVNIIPFFGDEVSQFGPPKTYGIDLTLKF